jgi:hypothetical protein
MRTALTLVLVACAALGQAPNDACVTASATTGGPLLGSNAGATTGPDPVPLCAAMTGDVWYSFTAPCAGVYTASTCAAVTTFATAVAVWSAAAGCGSLVELACSDACGTGAYLGASATFSTVAGTTYLISVGGNAGTSGVFELSVTLGAAMSVAFFSSGPGSLGYAVSQGPGGGFAFVAMTLNAGQFPLGWFYGIDIGWVELMNEIAIGFPFLTPLQPCGQAVVGPAFGLPSGLQIHAVGLGLLPGATIPTVSTFPALGVVP